MTDSTGRVRVEISGGPSADVPHEQGLTVLSAMELAQGQIEPDPHEQFTFGLQYYGAGLGYLLNMVNETYDSFISRGGEKATPFFYWNVLINGEPATASVDRTPVDEGDIISLEFQQFSLGQHGGTLMGRKHLAQQKA
jgi:hypothetical protein